MGGKYLTLPCTLSKNRNGVKLRALANSGVNGLIFLNTCVARDIAVYYNTILKPLPRLIRVKGFDGQT